MRSSDFRRSLWGCIAGIVIVGGYADLWYGGTAVAATLLTLGYLVAIPLALWVGVSGGEAPSAAEEAPPYRFAGGVSLGIFGLYLLTLAPTTGLWDASEYIAVARVLGIPHAPGNPLFVIVAHAFGLLPLPVTYAERINLLSATASAMSAGVWALVMFRLLRAWIVPRGVRYTIAALTALLGATTFTIWHQSVVSEKVYAVGLLGVAMTSWLALRWIDAPAESRRSDALLVLAAYVCALGFANHTAGFLPVPALLLLVGVSRPQTLRRVRLVVLGLAAVVLGLSPFVFEPIRAANQPVINEGNPTACVDGPQLHCILSRDTFDRVRGEINRNQYGGHAVSTRNAPWSVQAALWWRYFEWQWWRDGLSEHRRWQFALAAGFAMLALLGAAAHWRQDRTSFVYLGALTLTVTPGLIYYLNLSYGPTQHTELGASIMREGVERDYFFVWSFASLVLWMGLGITAMWSTGVALIQRSGRRLLELRRIHPAGPSARTGAWLAASPLLLIALIPLATNYRQASRSRQTLARDWASDVLLSLEPYAIVITNGDNDTFPLWYAQEVEGLRRDVTVVLAPYLKSDWYVRQLQHAPMHPYRGDGLPSYSTTARVPGRRRPFALSDSAADAVPQLFDPVARREFAKGRLRVELPPGVLTRDQLLVLQIIHDDLSLRPIYFAVGNYAHALGLDDHIVTQGLVRRLLEDRACDHPEFVAFPGGYLDVARSRELWTRYRGSKALLDESTLVEAIPSEIPTVYDVTAQLLAYGLEQRGDTASARAILQDNVPLFRALDRHPSAALRAPRRPAVQ